MISRPMPTLIRGTWGPVLVSAGLPAGIGNAQLRVRLYWDFVCGHNADIRASHHRFMNHEDCVHSQPAVQAASRLASGYDELKRVDRALRDAERALEAAHRQCAQHHDVRQAQALYLEVLALRHEARRVLVELAHMWV